MASTSITSSSGPLDVQGLVSQLMSVETQNLNRMNQKVSSYNSQISEYGTINSDLTALQSSLTNLSTGQFINTFKATSSNAAVLNATADTSAVAGLYNITVNNLATSQNLAFTGQASETDSLGNDKAVMTFTMGDGTTQTVDIAANSSLDDIRNAINAAGLGIAASVVKADKSGSPYRLVLTGSSVGSGNAFSTSLAFPVTTTAQDGTTSTTMVTTPTTPGQSALSFLNFNVASAVDANGNVTDSRLTAQAQDASLTVNGLTMTSSSNKVTNAINGVTMNLTQAGTSSLTVAADNEAITAQVQSFVDAYNKMRADSESLYGGDLKGDYTLVMLQDQMSSILNVPISGANGTTTVAYLAQIGISQQKDGTLKLDTGALQSAITKDPTAVANLFGNTSRDGYAQRFNSLINGMLGPSGLITVRSSTLNSQLKDVKDRVAQEQNRLNVVQAGYLTLYTKLNSSLSQMQQTSSSLSAMLASMKTS